MSEYVREGFSGRFAFYLAAAGSAIGLGNLWRFPYLVNTYGGGMFLLIYLVAMFTFGLILFMTEVAIGRKTGKTIIDAYASISSKYKIVGWFGLLVPILLLPYYCVLGGYVVRYMYAFGVGDTIGFDTIESSSEFYRDFITGSSGGFFDGPIIWFVIFGLLSSLILLRGINNGLEKVCKIGMPLLLVIMVALIAFIFTIPDIWIGVKRFFLPDFSSFSMDGALSAVGQVFYSLSLAQGIMIAFGSYMSKGVSIKKSMNITVSVDAIIAVLCGLLVVPIMFVYAPEFTSGSGLMFETLPCILHNIPFGDSIGFLFFALVFIAAWTSAIALGEAIVGSLCDSYGVSRKIGVAFLLGIIFTIGWLSCFGYGALGGFRPLGLAMLDFFDFIVSNILMPINAVILCIVVGYILKPKSVLDEVSVNGDVVHPTYYSMMIKYICPILLVAIAVMGLLPKLL